MMTKIMIMGWWRWRSNDDDNDDHFDDDDTDDKDDEDDDDSTGDQLQVLIRHSLSFLCHSLAPPPSLCKTALILEKS